MSCYICPLEKRMDKKKRIVIRPVLIRKRLGFHLLDFCIRKKIEVNSRVNYRKSIHLLKMDLNLHYSIHIHHAISSKTLLHVPNCYKCACQSYAK